MVQRSIEIVAGLCGSIAGLALLANLYSLSFSSNGYSPFGHPPHMTGMFALWAYAAMLALIAVGVILHGVPAIVGAGRQVRVAAAWTGRLALWLATMGLLALVYLSLPSIGLLFVPSALLALVASAFSLVPASASPARA